jgi:hypothetical protein
MYLPNMYNLQYYLCWIDITLLASYTGWSGNVSPDELPKKFTLEKSVQRNNVDPPVDLVAPMTLVYFTKIDNNT